MHGGGVLPGTVEFIEQLNRSGKPCYILTNDVAKLPATADVHYRGFGLVLSVVLGPPDSLCYMEMAGGETWLPRMRASR